MTSAADELRQAVREFLAATAPSEVVRRLMDTDAGYDETFWKRMASELGLHGIAVPERYGGAGAGTAELAVVFEEMGAALVCAPFFATVGLAIPAILTSGDEQAAADLIPRLADGGDTATVVLNDHLGPWDPTDVTLSAHEMNGDYVIDGCAPMVLDGHTAAIVLVAARGPAGISLFAVDGDAAELTRTQLAGLDRTRKIARLDFTGAPARLIGSPGTAAPGLALTSHIATVLLAAEQVGGAGRCLDAAVGYAKDRIQFGRPIGSFQAVKHRCADMLVEVEGARSAVIHAATVSDDELDELAIAASVAKLAASEAFTHAAFDNMRIHGGLGFTWEHDAHLYIRRAKASSLMFGEPDHHACRLADLITSASA